MEAVLSEPFLPIIHYLIIGVAGFMAGMLNALAGGGSFFTLSSLVFIGVPGVMANASSTLSVLPGYLGGTYGFRKEIAGLDINIIIRFSLITLCGAFIGALLLLATPNRLFDFIVPSLLILATLLFAFHTRLLYYLRHLERKENEKPLVNPYIWLFLISIYGGYFNGGLGIILLAYFTAIGFRDIHSMNGLKSLLSFVLSLMSAITFVFAGLVAWEYVIVMMITATLGGHSGAKLSLRLSQTSLRRFVIMVGTIMSVYFIMRLF